VGFVKKRFFAKERIKLFLFLMRRLKVSQIEAQRLIDRGRVFVKGETLTDKAAYIEGEIEVMLFEPNPKGVLPLFETADFAIFEKPSGTMVHPNTRRTPYSLLDEARHLFGDEANSVHRIDKETSGLVLFSKNKRSEKSLKTEFEKKSIYKEYLALVRGELSSPLHIEAPIMKNSDFSKIRLKVLVDDRGKFAKTYVEPIKYLPDIDATLIKAIPLTGRQHQIRAHLFHVKHPIIGDPIYGPETAVSIKYLEKQLSIAERIKYTGHARLMLHANRLRFNYEDTTYDVVSKYDFLSEIYL